MGLAELAIIAAMLAPNSLFAGYELALASVSPGQWSLRDLTLPGRVVSIR